MNVRLTAPSLGFWVDVRLRSFDGRWLAVADLAGEQELGLGRSGRDALLAALACLGVDAARALLAGVRQP